MPLFRSLGNCVRRPQDERDAEKRDELPPPHAAGQDGSKAAFNAALLRSGHGAALWAGILHRRTARVDDLFRLRPSGWFPSKTPELACGACRCWVLALLALLAARPFGRTSRVSGPARKRSSRRE